MHTHSPVIKVSRLYTTTHNMVIYVSRISVYTHNIELYWISSRSTHIHCMYIAFNDSRLLTKLIHLK